MYIKRKIEKDILRHLKAKEITIIVGARQVGKTTLIKSIKKDLDVHLVVHLRSLLSTLIKVI